MVLDTAHLIYTIRREDGLICTQTFIRTYNLGTTSDEKLGESLSRSNAIFFREPAGDLRVFVLSLRERFVTNPLPFAKPERGVGGG
jgi:hypothetical protein